MTASAYLSFPHIRGDLLVFVADDDVWLAPASGGRAWRLTADHARVSWPRLSPDGRLVAWTSCRDGAPEVHVAGLDEEGVDRRRLTYWGDARTRVCGWTPDGHVLALTAAGHPFPHFTWAYEVPPTGGWPRRLPFGPVGDLAVGSGATVLLTGSMGRDPATWKRYRGGTTGRLWVRADPGRWTTVERPPVADRVGFLRVLADLDGQLACPMLVAGRLVFIADHEGTGNLYSCRLDGSDLRRHTDSDGRYVRNASTDGVRVVYQCAGEVWLLEELDASPRRVELTLGTPAAGRRPRLVTGADRLDGLSCDEHARASAVEVAGTVHWVTHRDGPARVLAHRVDACARLPRVLGRTGQVVWVSDADGADALEVMPVTAVGPAATPRRLAAGRLGSVTEIAAAPDGSMVAVAAHEGELRLVDIATGAVTQLAASDNGPVTGLAWSPDAAWLAWSHPGPTPLRAIRLARVSDSSVVEVTDGRFTDTDPVFTADGLYLAFLSVRSFDPVYDAHVFELSFPYGCRPYLVPLATTTASPFDPLPDGRPVGVADGHPAAVPAVPTQPAVPATVAGAEGDGGAATAMTDDTGVTGDQPSLDPGTRPTRVDPAGMAERIVPVPVPESRYASLRAVEGGLVWLREPLVGVLGESVADTDDGTRPRPTLERFDLRRRVREQLIGELDWFEVSGDGRHLVVVDRGQARVVPASRASDGGDHDRSGDQVTVDLSRARVLVDPVARWRHAYAEAGLVMRRDFWVADMADVDWDGVLDEYRPLLDRVATAAEFADLLAEVAGELGSSHAYVTAAPDERPAADRDLPVGLLGADLERDEDGRWRVARVVPGESSDPRARSPLAAPGVAVEAGDVLVAVDGQPVNPDLGPGPLLAGTAGKPVELSIVEAGTGATRRVVVTPLDDDRWLRYHDWVAQQRRRVRELSGGRVGYLHVPDMLGEGWAHFHRDLRSEIVRDALIVDLRGNRGGHVSQLVVEKLARRVIAWDVPRHLQPQTYPQDAPRGPVVAIADEYAGSDGDIVTAAIRILGIGPVVGARTWGGVIGIDGLPGHRLADGTAITVPRYAFWFERYGWGVENHGVDPDIPVLITPDDWVAGRDPQLETAVQVAMRTLADRPPAAPPDPAGRPSRARPALPDRSGHSGAW